MTPIKRLTDAQLLIKDQQLQSRHYYWSHRSKARKYSKANSEKRKATAAKWRLDNRERYLKQQFKYDITRRGNLTIMERTLLIYRRTMKREAEARRGKGSTML